MTKTEKSLLISNFLNKILPDAKCSLDYTKDYELLIAVMLSAQTTDKAVNKVTKVLFDKYTCLEDLNRASYEDIYEIIKTLGLAKTKASNIKLIAKELVDNFNSCVPSDKKILMTLNGVGNKTANVVRIEYFDLPEMPVDTHIHRISKRLGIIKMDEDVLHAEKNLKSMFMENQYKKLHHQLIMFGRTICKAQNPICDKCELHDICKNYKKNSSSTTDR